MVLKEPVTDVLMEIHRLHGAEHSVHKILVMRFLLGSNLHLNVCFTPITCFSVKSQPQRKKCEQMQTHRLFVSYSYISNFNSKFHRSHPLITAIKIIILTAESVRAFLVGSAGFTKFLYIYAALHLVNGAT